MNGLHILEDINTKEIETLYLMFSCSMPQGSIGFLSF